MIMSKKSVERIMALWSLYLNVAKFVIDVIHDDLRTSLTKNYFLQSDCVGWSWSSGSRSFFFKLTLSKCKKTQKKQKYFPISAKAMPWSLWKWLGSQRIFEGIKFPNPIAYTPGQAHVTNINPKCSFFTGLERVKTGSHFFPHCTWGVHEDGYWNQPW